MGDEGGPCFGPSERLEAERLIGAGLQEDVPAGDLTSEILLPPEARIRAHFVPREDGVLCGVPILTPLFHQIEPTTGIRPRRCDGDSIRAHEALVEIDGCAQAIFRGERLALNFLQRLSGIATVTRRYAEALEGTGCALYDTRKTTPGWRALEKYAVRAGGGNNHRLNLSDFVLIKDNHRQVLRAVGKPKMGQWVRDIRLARPDTFVELEVDSVEELKEALEAEVDLILLDNFSCQELKRSVDIVRRWPYKQPLLEASGGIDLSTVRQVAETGVHRIAVGRLTHSAVALDIGLDLVEVLS